MNKVLFLVMACMFTVFMFVQGCGDGTTDNDPTDRFPNGGSIDNDECKDLCNTVGGCIGSSKGTYVEDCKAQCNLSGFFDAETVNCLKSAGSDCTKIQACQLLQ